MPLKTAICKECGEKKPVLTNGICPSCSGRKGGFPKGRKRTEVADPAPPLEETTAPPKQPSADVPEEHAPAVEPPTSRAPPSSVSASSYECEGCGVTIDYGQRVCKSCGIWLDWRHTRLEKDDDYIVCPECGAICGYGDSAVKKCPHCGFTPS
jgi:hypothetical protein